MNKLLLKYKQPTIDFIISLRDGRNIILFDRKTKYFHQFSLSKKAKGICWQRHVSKDRRAWINWNECLSLREVLDCRAEIAVNCQETCFKRETA